MREIKFRGRTIPQPDEGIKSEWRYGYLTVGKGNTHYISTPRMEDGIVVGTTFPGTIVIIETVGQFTGLKDKNGTEIYEGDVIDFTWFYYVGQEIEETKIGEVAFINDAFVFSIPDGYYPFYDLNFDSESDIEVIGNIYENPELLKEKEVKND